MRTFLYVSAFCVATAQGELSAQECTFQHTTSAEAGCEAIQSFAKCLASVSRTDPNRKSAENVLAEAEATTLGCDITVTPSFNVVDRELRVVTQEDVRFSRFRRDDVGVFELKEMIEGNTGSIEDLKTSVQTVTDAIATSVVETKEIKETAAELDAKVVAGDAALTAKMVLTDAAVAALDASVKAQLAAAEEAAANEVEIAASWQFVGNPIQPTNSRSAFDIMVYGKNFAQYDYSPGIAPFVECTFALTTDSSSTVVTAGQTKMTDSVGGPTYAVVCPSPTFLESKTSFQLSLAWKGAAKSVAIPFSGASTNDKLTFDMTWSALVTADNKHVMVDVGGLNTEKSYVCKFTQSDNKNIVKSADGEFVEGQNGELIDCGKQPTGFTISNENTASVIFELFVKGTKTQASYAGPTGGGPTVQFDTCKNGAKDGKETDTDCGGGCDGCPANGSCKATSDCADGIPCVSGKCGLDGKTKATAGKTCKAIKLHIKDSKNGYYYVTGPKGEYKSDPKKVMCWQEDRDGGGWTLAVKTWYGRHHSLVGSGRRQTNNIDSGVMSNMGQYYKMDDKEIRTYMGQPDPNNDDFGAQASEITAMRDQSSFNNGHSSHNREYTIMKKYTARWYFYTWRNIRESTTQSELSSYAMPKHYGGGMTSAGEGELNWRGNPNCNRNGAGINCYNTHKAVSPWHKSPNGGHHCKQNLGKGWGGQLEWFMSNTNYDTYTYFCQGAQHSSANRFASRTWIRSPDSQKEW